MLLALLPAMAQQRRDGQHRPFNPQEFKARMEQFVREKACLTQEEADKLFPVYHEMKAKQLELNRKMRHLKRHKPADEKEYACIVSQITCLGVELAKLEQTYYAKMCALVPAQKIYALILAEDAFHRDMLRNAGPRGDGRRDQRPDGNHWPQH